MAAQKGEQGLKENRRGRTGRRTPQGSAKKLGRPQFQGGGTGKGNSLVGAEGEI